MSDDWPSQNDTNSAALPTLKNKNSSSMHVRSDDDREAEDCTSVVVVSDGLELSSTLDDGDGVTEPNLEQRERRDSGVGLSLTRTVRYSFVWRRKADVDLC